VVHSAAAPAAAHSAVVAPAHDTPSPPSSSQVNEYTPLADAMRMYPRIRDATRREEASARRGGYWAAPGGNYTHR
jgi:hypothetical protein